MEYNCFKRSLCNFQKGMITETLNLGLFTKSLLSSRIPYEEEKKKKRYVLIRFLSTNTATRSKSDSCTPKKYHVNTLDHCQTMWTRVRAW